MSSHWPICSRKGQSINYICTCWKRSLFIPNPKKGNVKECSNYCTIALISHNSKVMLKILQARLQQYVNRELPDVQAGFRKGRGTRDQIANIHWIRIKARQFQKNIYFCFMDNIKAFHCVDHNKRWKILNERGIQATWPVSWEICMQVRKQQLIWTWNNRLVPRWERSISRLYVVTCLFNLYAEYIMWNARLDEAQAGIKIVRRNINNLRYADDTTLMAESEEELKSL